jgi:AAA domain
MHFHCTAENFEQIAREFLGEPNRALSTKRELRFGAHGSMSIDLQKGVWFDHEAGEGGDEFGFVKVQIGGSDRDVFEWLEQRGFKDGNGVSANSRNISFGAAADPLKGVSLKKESSKQLRIVQTWIYVNEAGVELFEVCRLENGEIGADRKPDKTYRQRHKTAEGYVNNVKGIRQVPYRLPELIEAIAQGKTVFVAEGEKCADAIVALGAAATCNAMGAGKWPDEITPHFKDADICILPDHDEPGAKHASLVAAKLQGIAKRVRILELPDLPAKGDVADWIAAGGTLEQLQKFVDAKGREPAAAIVALPFKYRDPKTIPPRQWLHAGHYVRGFLSATIAPGGIGKTSLQLVEAVGMAIGRDLLKGTTAKPLKVWYWNLEDPEVEIERRIAAILLHYRIEPTKLDGQLFVNTEQPLVIATKIRDEIVVAEPVVDCLAVEMKQLEIDVLIIDPFVSSHRVPENDNGAIDTVAKTWFRLGRDCGCAIELAHHIRKPASGSTAEITVDDARGAGSLKDAGRSIRVLNSMSKEEAEKIGIKLEHRRRYFHVDDGKTNMKPPAESIEWRKLVSVPLDNGTEEHEGDWVGVVTTWKKPGALEGLTARDLLQVQKCVLEGKWREDPRADNWVGKPVAKALGLDAREPTVKRRIQEMVRTWLRDGALRVFTDLDHRRHEKEFVEVGEWAV